MHTIDKQRDSYLLCIALLDIQNNFPLLDVYLVSNLQSKICLVWPVVRYSVATHNLLCIDCIFLVCSCQRNDFFELLCIGIGTYVTLENICALHHLTLSRIPAYGMEPCALNLSLHFFSAYGPSCLFMDPLPIGGDDGDA